MATPKINSHGTRKWLEDRIHVYIQLLELMQFAQHAK